MGSDATIVDPAAEVAGERAEERAAEAEAPFESATHAVLFEAEGAPSDVCDVCGGTVVETENDEGYAVTGRGEYLWFRHGERRVEEPVLCASCAMALGVSALARWEIEEEEG